MTKKFLMSVLVVGCLSALIGCTPASQIASTPAATKPTPTFPSEQPAGPVEITWWVGLTKGGSEEEVKQQELVAQDFNRTHADIQLVLTKDGIGASRPDAYLKHALANGGGPDIIGPVGLGRLFQFREDLLDIEPLIEQSGYDLNSFHPALVDYYRIGSNEELIALPFAVYPSALWYNRDLFNAAGLAYPPHEYGAPYVTSSGEEMPWNIDTLEWLAKQLTLDANGRTPDDPGFDPSNVVQFGFDMPVMEAHGQAVLFGPGVLADSAGNAVIPPHWREFWLWYYDGIWIDHFIPDHQTAMSGSLNVGNTFASGRIAMMPQNSWYVLLVGDVDWDVAAIPEYNGIATAKLHSDAFAIVNQTKNPEAAFEVLTWLLNEKVADLFGIYPDDGFPASLSLQDQFKVSLETQFPGVDFDVFLAGLDHIDLPGHEAGLHTQQTAGGRLVDFKILYLSTPGLDMNAEIDILQADLQAIFDAAQQ